MKKKIVVLGSAFMLFLNASNAQMEDMSFGLKGSISFFLPVIEKAKKDTYEGKNYIGFQGGIFAEYRLLDDMLSVGLDTGYAKKGILLAQKEGDKKEAPIDIHTVDVAMPIAWLPMGRDGGLSVFAGPKMYVKLSSKGKIPEGQEEKLQDNQIRKFNFGATGGVKYEILESGFFVAANYDYFFQDLFSNKEEGKALKADLFPDNKKGEDYELQGPQLSLGYDFARLME